MKLISMATSCALIAACGDDPTELSRVASALGGLPAIRATTTQSITASGDRYDQHECFSPVPGERDDTTVVPDKLAGTTWTGSIRGVVAPGGGASVGEPTVLGGPGGRVIRLFDMAVDHSKGTVIPIVDDAQVLFVTDLYNPTADGRGGPLPDGRDRYAHDLYARQLYTNLATIGYTPALQPAMKFVGGHGAVGNWGELCVWGNGFGPFGKPSPGQPIDPSKVCPP